jgi:transposase
MKRRGYQKYIERKKRLSGKRVAGIDPASKKHQLAIVDEQGIQVGGSFAFPISYKGYTEKLWKELTRILGTYNPDDLVFAIETSGAIWKSITDYLTDQGYMVLLVSPLTTFHTRPVMNQDYSKTDPKDALLIATNARNGSYAEYRRFGPEINCSRRLSITYGKLAKDRQKAITRLKALIQEVFPEYLDCLSADTLTSLSLLEKYFLPEHFLNLSVDEEAPHIRSISRGTYGPSTLTKLKELANKSIGSHTEGEEEALRLTLHAWISQVRRIDESLDKISAALIAITRKNEYLSILTSVKGISDVTASRFIAECRDLNDYTHYKQIEKLAGANVRLADSGVYQGTRRISKIGNKRLLSLLYVMATQVVRHVPEIRIKFIKRQLRKKSYRKNIVACIPWLLKLLMALIKEKRPYVYKEETLLELNKLELKYTDMRNKEKKMRDAA